VHELTSAFAGGRKNVGLGRSERLYWGSFPRRHSHRRQRVSSRGNEEGNVVGVRESERNSNQSTLERARFDWRTRPSLSLETRTTSRWSSDQHGRFGIEVGQTHERGRNRQRGQVERTYVRLAACHRSFAQAIEVVRDASEKEGGPGHRPCEETRPTRSVPVRRRQLQKSKSGIGSRTSLHAALQKGWRWR